MWHNTTHSSLQQLNEYKKRWRMASLPLLQCWYWATHEWKKRYDYLLQVMLVVWKRRAKIKNHIENTPFTTRTMLYSGVAYSCLCLCAYLFLHNMVFLTSSNNNNNVHKTQYAICLGMYSALLNTVLHLCLGAVRKCCCWCWCVLLRLSLNCSVLLLHLHYITLSHFRLLIVCNRTKNILTQFIY